MTPRARSEENQKFAHGFISASDPYAHIADWWGEPLSAELLQRMKLAPASHFDEFRMHVYKSANQTQLEPTKRGELRPLMLPSWVHDSDYPTSRLRKDPLDRYFQTAATLLLYCHQVVLQDPIIDATGTPRQIKSELISTFQILLHAKPLADTGSIVFVRKKSMAQHPATTSGYFSETDWSSPQGRDADEVIARVRALREDPASVNREVFHFQTLIGAGINVASKWPGACSLLARSRVEQALLRLVVDRAGQMVDARERHLQKLVAMTVPKISSNVRELAKIRGSGEEFAEWRSCLAAALNEVRELPESDERWAHEARAIVHSELAPIRERLEKASERSPALVAAKKGFRDFALSGIGALGGAMAGGGLGPALVGAATGKATEVFVEYLKAKRSRRDSKAILDVTMAFVEPD